MGTAAIDDAVARLRGGGRVLVAGWEDGVGGTVVAAGHAREWFEAHTLGFRMVELAERGPSGFLSEPSPESAAVELLQLAGRSEGGYGILPPVRTKVSGDAVLPRFADDEGLVLIDHEDLAHHLWCNARLVVANGSAPVPTRSGTFEGHVFTSLVDGLEHIALVFGEVAGDGVVTRVHSECLTGDVFGSRRCDCGAQLEMSLDHIAGEGRGVVIYLRGHEGRGIGLAEKFSAYRLQDRGLDTVEANHRLGFEDDERDFRLGAQILEKMRIGSVRLLTNNPAKIDMMQRCGIGVTERVPLRVGENPFNADYLAIKAAKSGHLF